MSRVSYFVGDGLNSSAEDLGYSDVEWSVGDIIEVVDYDYERERGEFTERYRIGEIGVDSDGNPYAVVYYIGEC